MVKWDQYMDKYKNKQDIDKIQKTKNKIWFYLFIKWCESNCSCGCCNYRYSIGGEAPVCNCTQKLPIDHEKQQYVIS